MKKIVDWMVTGFLVSIVVGASVVFFVFLSEEILMAGLSVVLVMILFILLGAFLDKVFGITVP